VTRERLLAIAVILAAASPVRAASDEDGASTELVLRLGNESNGPDGVWGPVTYGVLAGHRFQGGLAIEAGYVRLHEPGWAALKSGVDEAVLALSAPEIHWLGQPFVFSARAWRNRTIDMYTTVGGVEVSRPGRVSFLLGGYAGDAERGPVEQRYVAFQLGAGATFGLLDVGAFLVDGVIGGSGHHTVAGLDAGWNFLTGSRLPITLTLSLQGRSYRFADGGPASHPDDALIAVLGAEVHFENLLGLALEDRREERRCRQGSGGTGDNEADPGGYCGSTTVLASRLTAD
jgi:hypothetical protein